MNVSKTTLTIIFVIAAILCGAMVLTVALFSGMRTYFENVAPDAPPNAEALASAVTYGFSIYLIGLIPLEMVSYQTIGFKRTFALFLFVPIMVYLFWASIGATLSLYILWAVAALASYQTLVIYTRRGHD